MHARRPALRPLRLRGAAVVLGTTLVATALVATALPSVVPARGVDANAPVLAVAARNAAQAAPDLSPFATAPGQVPSEMYLDAQQHAADPNTFVPGGRVNVGFQPRPEDGSAVGGPAPRALPAGRLSGTQMARDTTTVPAAGAGAPIPASTPDPVTIPARAAELCGPGARSSGGAPRRPPCDVTSTGSCRTGRSPIRPLG